MKIRVQLQSRASTEVLRPAALRATLFCAIAVEFLGVRATTTAQTFTTLKHFTGTDGRWPETELTLAGTTLYGTTYRGGSSDLGTVFKVETDGSGFTVLRHCINATGAHPQASLTISGSVLYGTTRDGGSSGYGTVFRVNTNGTGYAVLKHFSRMTWNAAALANTNTDGANPQAGLALSGGLLYGTTVGGGKWGSGTIFKLSTDGSGFNVLRHFSVRADSGTGYYTNSDGASPWVSLTLAGSVMYGATSSGGSHDCGTVFKMNADGTGYMVLKEFLGTASDGRGPGRVVLSGSTLYGTTWIGGSLQGGTVFKVNTDGTGFTILNHFSEASWNPATQTYTNSDGTTPGAGLVLSGGFLFGTTQGGGNLGRGALFQVRTNGTDFQVLRHMDFSYGYLPIGGMILSDGALYGTTRQGGLYGNPYGYGTLFKLALSIPLTMQASADAIVLRWSNPSFTLQSAPEVTGIYTNIPGATSPHTNFTVRERQFFRLIY